jgi:hypothetical protein
MQFVAARRVLEVFLDENLLPFQQSRTEQESAGGRLPVS